MSVLKDYDYKIEDYQRFHGDADQVLEILEHCPECSETMFFSYIYDAKNLTTKETGTCPKCSFGQLKHIYLIS